MTGARRATALASGLAVWVLAFAVATVAHAEGPTLRVTNLGQPSAPIEVGQAPFDVASMGSCGSPFTLASEGACPAGTWPALGRAWGPIEDVAGGDTLRLEFSAPVTTVRAASTSNFEPGLIDPGGTPIGNFDVMPDTAANATTDPGVWTVTVPALDARAISTSGYTFSVVAQDGTGYHDYPFGIRSPRYANEATRCGRAYYSTGWEQTLCLLDTKALPPGIGSHKAHPKCRKGFRRKKVRGKVRCVKAKKPHRHRR